MARPTRRQQREFEALLEQLEPAVRDAFYAMVADLKSGVDWKALIKALDNGDVDAALLALNIEAAAFYSLASSLEAAYVAGGVYSAAAIHAGDSTIRFRFNMTDPGAKAWIANNVGLEITKKAADTVDLVRKVIVEGFARGEHPFTIGLDIAGRVGAKGVRTGGVLGLDGPRADRFMKVAVGMRSPAGVQDLVRVGPDGPYVRYKVNKATENKILSAYLKGTAVPEAQRVAAEKQYYNALLKARADTIARTETGQAVMGAKHESWTQAAASQGLSTDDIIKAWRHGSSSKFARDQHIAMNNKEVRGLYATFDFEDGVSKLHALDGEGGGAHDINCGCGTDYRLDRAKGLL